MQFEDFERELALSQIGRPCIFAPEELQMEAQIPALPPAFANPLGGNPFAGGPPFPPGGPEGECVIS